MRYLHLIHSLDVLLSYRATSPNRGSRLIPFILKFALFFWVNFLSEVSGLSFHRVEIDDTIMSEFIMLYVVLEIFWLSETLQKMLFIFKGDISLLTRSQKILRALYYTLFTTFRVLSSYKMIEKFGEDFRHSFVVVLLFLEINGIILKTFKGERHIAKLFSSLPQSFLVSFLVAWDHRTFPLLASLLAYRHLVSQIV